MRFFQTISLVLLHFLSFAQGSEKKSIEVDTSIIGIPATAGKTQSQMGTGAVSIVLSSLNLRTPRVVSITSKSVHEGKVTLQFDSLKQEGLSNDAVKSIASSDPGLQCGRAVRANALIYKLTTPEVYYEAVAKGIETQDDFKKALGITGQGTLIGNSGTEAIHGTKRSRVHAFSTPNGLAYRVEYQLDGATPGGFDNFQADAVRFIFPLRNGLKGEMWFNAAGKKQNEGPADLVGSGPGATAIPPTNFYFPWAGFLARNISNELNNPTIESNARLKRDSETHLGVFAKIAPELAAGKDNALYDLMVSQIRNQFSQPVKPEQAAIELGISLRAARELVGQQMARGDFEGRFCKLREKGVASDASTPHNPALNKRETVPADNH